MGDGENTSMSSSIRKVADKIFKRVKGEDASIPTEDAIAYSRFASNVEVFKPARTPYPLKALLHMEALFPQAPKSLRRDPSRCVDS